MKYIRFNIDKYKAIKSSSIAVLYEPIPIIGVNESGKSSVLEALAHFDYRNDIIADKRGWKVLNRYNTSEVDLGVEAVIFFDSGDMEMLLAVFSEEEKATILGILNDESEITIKRTFRKSPDHIIRTYTISGHEDELTDKFCREVIQKLPRVFYFDNFLENPIHDSIKFDDQYFTDPNFHLDEDQLALEGIFLDSEFSIKDFLSETDENTKNTNISTVNKNVTKKLIHDWKKMHFDKDDLEMNSVSDMEIALQQNRSDPHSIDINIVERFKDNEGQTHDVSMPLSDRSLGFRWFFNFSIKKSYGAKDNEKFIYLFDEPGSYLHNGAQKVLMTAMHDLAKNHPVIYSTHSEFLLDPEIININNIKIVQKTDRQISLIPLAQTSEKKDQGALSSLYNALRMKIPISSTLNQKVILTEGITDFYFWKMLIKNVVILPGFGAGQNEYLISIAIGTSKKYIALFDGDDAGEEAINKYIRLFGVNESINWKKYINSEKKIVKLEKILSENDKNRLDQLLNLNFHDTKKAITSLFFSDKQKEFWTNIDKQSKDNINENLRILKEALNIRSEKILNYSL